MFFDFECSQDTPVQNRYEHYLHKPKFCVLQQACYNCLKDEDMTKNCVKCGVRQHVFSGAETLTRFKSLVTRPRPEFSKIIIPAHNMKAYNGQFVLNYMTTELKWKPEVIMNGSKIQVIKHSNITILDSLNFFSCKLSALPEMFQLNFESKGYFPHFFNKQNNWE